ncbi:LCP family protein [Amnibacterium sp.]|uniref:LCP family protein n=1 Tax=Amnibacterium sp. TaxID=1872496 RepID=UPI003F7C95C8
MTRDQVVRHARRSGRGSGALRSALRLAGIALVVVAVSAASLTAIFVHTLSSTVASHSVVLHGTHPEPPQPLSGAFNVLVVGADNAPGQHGFGAARQSTQNDVDILVHVAADHRSAVVLSMPRDLIVDHPACVSSNGTPVPADGEQPLNVDLNRGGLGCVVTTVEHLTGLSIPYAAQFSFAGTIAMADAVGGVPVCTTRAIDDPKSGLRLPAGRSVISGRTALAYLRDRHGVGDGSDLARISSQQAYMSSLLRRAVSSDTLTNPAHLIALATATARNVDLSTSMSSPDVLMGMMVALLQVPLHDIALVQLPTAPYPANLNKVIPAPGLAPVLLQRLRDDTPVVLAKGTHGYATSTKSSTSATRSSAHSSPTPSPSRSSSGTAPISGLSGQNADQTSCSVAAG